MARAKTCSVAKTEPACQKLKFGVYFLSYLTFGVTKLWLLCRLTEGEGWRSGIEAHSRSGVVCVSGKRVDCKGLRRCFGQKRLELVCTEFALRAKMSLFSSRVILAAEGDF